VGGFRLSNYEYLNVNLDAGVLTCTINTPSPLNLINSDAHDELEDFFYQLRKDEEIGVVVLTGTGNTFSAGGDLNDVGAGVFHKGLPGGAFTRGGGRLIRNLVTVPQPIIAALNGTAAGLAASIVLHCDIILATEHAKIGDPHVTAGVVAGDGGAVAWPLQISLSRAKEYLMLGELLDAREAERIGLINHVYPDDEFQAAVDDMARRLAAKARYAVRWTKSTLNSILLRRVDEVLDLGLVMEGLTAATGDHREALAAFFERRQPNFTGE
jgi:enoyl-CoA hydratase